jgi:hypothetical protein
VKALRTNIYHGIHVLKSRTASKNELETDIRKTSNGTPRYDLAFRHLSMALKEGLHEGGCTSDRWMKLE